MSLEYAIRELAKRHNRDVAVLLEVWNERAAIREYLSRTGRPMAELEALHEVEAMYKIGQHAPRPQQPAAPDAGLGPSSTPRRRAVRKPHPGDSRAG